MTKQRQITGLRAARKEISETIAKMEKRQSRVIDLNIKNGAVPSGYQMLLRNLESVLNAIEIELRYLGEE